MSTVKLLFVITQFSKGGAEVALLNLFKQLPMEGFAIDFLILNQVGERTSESLIPLLPKWINVLDFIASGSTHESDLIKNKEYDWAFHIGEWSSPRLVAREVKANKKALWIHNDLDKAEYFDSVDFIEHETYFTHFIFVSTRSMNYSIDAYPMITTRATVIHNINDEKGIMTLSQEQISDEEMLIFNSELPVLLTCANIRTQKNHLRQVLVMNELRQRNVYFKWVNIGSMVEKDTVLQLQQAIDEYKLNDSFYLLGIKENPYPYISRADAVTVLSDYESWSLVISESLILGVPVITTPTSGAMHQVIDGVNGFVTDFDISGIADVIEEFISNKDLRTSIKKSTKPKINTQLGINEFLSLIGSAPQKRTILYMDNNINYRGGLREATAAQISEIKDDYDITLLSVAKPQEDIHEQFSDIKIISPPSAYQDRPYLSLSTKDVLRGNYTLKQKITKLYYFGLKILKVYNLQDENKDKLHGEEFRELCESYDNVVVLSENSSLRFMVSTLIKPKKIQWIHIEYAKWMNQNDWTKACTKDDSELYMNFDAIVTLSEQCRQSFVGVHPHLKNKTFGIRNITPTVAIKRLSKIPMTQKIDTDSTTLKIITIARLSDQKNHKGLLQIALNLKNAHVKFRWYFVGDGELNGFIQNSIWKLGLSDNIIMTGHLENPYPLLAKMDLFVLFSLYEGTPIVIEEARVLGVPVLTRYQVGMSEQVDDGVTGFIVDGNEMDASLIIKRISEDSTRLHQLKFNAVNRNDNQIDSIKQLHNLFS